MDSVDQYEVWIEDYCTRTNAPTDGKLAAALLFNRDVLVVEHRATRDELDACARRLVSSGRKLFPDEHVPAIVGELRRLRTEAADADRAEVPTVECVTCGGCGWATVPHPQCVRRGRLECFPGTSGVYTVAVTCDDCPAGRAAREGEERRFGGLDDAGRRRSPRRLTFTQYLSLVTTDDPIGLLRRAEAERADRARAGRQAGTALPDLFAELLARVGGCPTA